MATVTPTNWRRERARVASLSRSRPPDDPDLVAARTSLREARITAQIEDLVNSAPPLTAAMRDRLALIVQGAG
jgi:hypothetical protein